MRSIDCWLGQKNIFFSRFLSADYTVYEGLSNGPIKFKSAGKIWPLLELLGKKKDNCSLARVQFSKATCSDSRIIFAWRPWLLKILVIKMKVTGAHNFYIWCCFLYIRVSFGNWAKRNLKNLQFWPQSLGAMLEYWYIERGLFPDAFHSRPQRSRSFWQVTEIATSRSNTSLSIRLFFLAG